MFNDYLRNSCHRIGFFPTLLAAVLLTFVSLTVRAQVPQVELSGNFGNDYTQGIITVTDTDGISCTYHIEAKWRGHSTKGYTKKSYSVKLFDDNGESLDASLLGMRNDNKWILDAMAIDLSRMRNRVSFDLWNDFAADSYIKREYDERSVNGTHGRFVELWLNGVYNGVYCMTEPIDRKQLRLKKYKNSTVRGVLYKSNGWRGTTYGMPSNYEDYDNSQNTWMDWETKYPTVEDEGVAEWTPLADAIQFVINANKKQFTEEVATRFDLPVWIDYFLFIKVIYAIDNTVKNIYNYVYDTTQDSKVGIAPWDLDATWGRSYDASPLGYEAIDCHHNLEKRLKAIYPNYEALVAKRYFELRETFFDADSLKERFRKYFKLFNDSGIAERETARWNGVDGLTLDFDNEMEYISTWIDHRLAVLDLHFQKNNTAVRNLYQDNEVSSSAWFDLSGRRLRDKPQTSGIYIKDGRKVMVQR